jgi:hypothetical protein
VRRRKFLSSEEDWEHNYPPGSSGWKVNRKIDAIEAQALKSGTVFLIIASILLAAVFVEFVFHPFQLWREPIDRYPLTTWHTALYAATLFLIGYKFLHYGVLLFWHGWKTRALNGNFEEEKKNQ